MNPYITDLVNRLSKYFAIEPRFFQAIDVLCRRFDLIHLHWPENLVSSSRASHKWAKRLIAVLLLAKVRLFNVPVVRTVHNLESHNKRTRFEKWFMSWLDSITDVRIYLNESAACLDGNEFVILHSAYAKEVRERRERSSSGEVLAFGLLRPYKGFETLIESFRKVSDCELRLRIAGAATNACYLDALKDLATGDSRISIEPGFLASEELQRSILAADLVVLPYKKIYNSGALLLALSLGVPVLTTRSAATDSLQHEVGPDSVLLFDGILTPTILQQATDDAKRIRAAGTLPQLSRRSPHTVAELHHALYRECIEGTRRGHPFVRRELEMKVSELNQNLFLKHSPLNRAESDGTPSND